MFLKKLSFLIVLVSISNILFAEDKDSIYFYNEAVIWRGFNHLWSYNHRINRLGCQVEKKKHDSAKISYFSATGLGSDSTFYKVHYSYISSPYLRFYEGEIKLKISGKETQLLNLNKEISFEMPYWLKDQAEYKGIINGFDLKSNSKSDLPILLDIQIDDPIALNNNTLSFKLNTNWVANCRSAECSIINNTVNYDLKINYLIIGYQKENASSTEIFNKKSYAWTVDVAPPYETMLKEHKGLPNLFEKALIGIKGFSFVLNEEQWLQELNYETTINEYWAKDGKINFNIGMQFLAWKEGMKSKAVSKSKAFFAHRKSGWATMSMNSLLLQFKEGVVKDASIEGSMFWPGWNTKADHNLSVDENWIKLK